MADGVARIELACPDFPPDGVEQLGEAIKRIGVQLSIGVAAWLVSVRSAEQLKDEWRQNNFVKPLFMLVVGEHR